MVALLSLSSWYLVIAVWVFLVVPWVCMQFMIVVFPDHNHLLFFLDMPAKLTKNVLVAYLVTAQITGIHR